MKNVLNLSSIRSYWVQFSIAIAVAGILIVACSPAGEPSPAPTRPVEIAPTRSTSPPDQATETRIPTSISSPTSTSAPSPAPTSSNALIWSDGIPDPIILDYRAGPWSPNSNELLLYRCQDAPLTRAAAPDYEPHAITHEPIPCPYDFGSMMWSPDGQVIFFAGPLSVGNPRVEDLDYSALWVVQRDGNNPHRFSDETAFRWLSFYGWLDDQILAIWSYGGGGTQIVNLLSTRLDQFVASAFYYGNTYSPTIRYLAASVGDKPWVFAISDSIQDQAFDMVQGGYAKPYPIDHSEDAGQIFTMFVDWLPGTSKMLVQWTRDQENSISQSKLVLWDVDTNQIDTLAPTGESGLFSPRGDLLAYVTNEAAMMDADNRPIYFEEHITANTDVSFIQLLDLTNGRIFLSLPVTTEVRPQRPYEQFYFWDGVYVETNFWAPLHPSANFSPDGRYFAFNAPGTIEINDSGWPIAIDQPNNSAATLGIVDLETKQLVFTTTTGYLPVWSPGADKLVYRDETGNLILLDIQDLTTTRLTTNVGAHNFGLSWSYDGSYIAIAIEDREDYTKNQTGIVLVP